MIHPDLLLSEVNGMSLQTQITYIALDSGFVNKIRGIHLHLGEIEFIHPPKRNGAKWERRVATC